MYCTSQRYRRWRTTTALTAAVITATALPVVGDDLYAYPMEVDFYRVCGLLPVLVLIEVAIVIVEARVYQRVLGLHPRRALWSSLAANVASFLGGIGLTLVGVSYALFGASGEPPFAGHFMFGLAVTLIVELPVLLVVNRDFGDRGRLLRAALITNLLTYSVGMAVVAATSLLLQSVLVDLGYLISHGYPRPRS